MLKVIRSFTASNGNYYRIGEEICQGEYDELTKDETMFIEIEGLDPEVEWREEY